VIFAIELARSTSAADASALRQPDKKIYQQTYRKERSRPPLEIMLGLKCQHRCLSNGGRVLSFLGSGNTLAMRTAATRAAQQRHRSEDVRVFLNWFEIGKKRGFPERLR
jgi:hypothetical protein